MTYKSKTDKCKKCGEVRLLLDVNDFVCIPCLQPKKKEEEKWPAIEGCECVMCKSGVGK